MDRLKSILFIFLSLLLINFCTIHNGNAAGRDCLEGAQYSDLWELIKSAAEKPDSLTWILALEDRKAMSGILAELVAKKNESDEKTREGSNIVEEYKTAYSEWDAAQNEQEKLKTYLEQNSHAISASDLSQKKSELLKINEYVSVKYADFKIKGEKVDAITEKFKLIGNDADDLVKKLISKVQEIQNKQSSFIDEESLWQYLQNLKTQSYKRCK